VCSTAASLLTAWEAGAVEAAVDRAPTLLRSLGRLPPGTAVERLTVGQCDVALLALRRELFGERLEAVATCPECGTEVELDLSISVFEDALLAAEPRPTTLLHDGFRITYRPPLNEDLSALVGREELDATAELLSRCVLDASGPDGARRTPAELPASLGDVLLDAMADSDPGASIELAVTCVCGHRWRDELDIRTMLWADLTDWLGRTLAEVHQLAREYGWSEEEILSLPAWRRRWYLEAAAL
jgi:hypothetical protein